MVRVPTRADPQPPGTLAASSHTTGCSSTGDCAHVETRKPAVEAAPEVQHRPPGGVLPNPLVDDFKETHARRGILIPLKTTQEVRQDHVIVQAYITRAPTKSANEVIMCVSRPLLLAVDWHR